MGAGQVRGRVLFEELGAHAAADGSWSRAGQDSAPMPAMLTLSQVFPVRVSDTPDDESAERGDGDEEDEGGCFGGFFGGIGRTLMDAKDGVGDMLTDCGVLPPGRPSGGRGEGRWTENWMRFFGPALANLKLKDLSIPGTHNSGTCSMVRPVVVGHLAVCVARRAKTLPCETCSLQTGTESPDVDRSRCRRCPEI